MRNTIMILMSAILGLITAAAVMAIGGRMNHNVELQSNLSSVVEKTVGEAANGTGTAADDEKMLAACVENLAVALDTDTEVTVEVMEADRKKGILAVRVKEKFMYPNGRTGNVQWERIAIRNQMEEETTEQYEVRFYESRAEMTGKGAYYKSYTVQEGERILAPVTPEKEDAAFVCWKDSKDYIADFSQPVQQNLVYYAQWR